MSERTRIYKVVREETLEKLEEEVNSLLASGWDLVGGISIVTATDWRENDLRSSYILECYAQAMITTL